METTGFSLEHLKADLLEIQREPGSTVMLHASLRTIGRVHGGAATIIRAVLETVGSEGTILMLVGAKNALYDLAEWPEPKRKAMIAAREPYDAVHTPANPEWGVLGEVLRTWDGAHRSQHPDYSFVAVGRMARELTADHHYNYCHGPSSPLGKLCDMGGKVLLLGAPFQSVTLIHLCEHLATVAGKQVLSYEAPILREGRKEFVSIERFNTRSNIPGYTNDDYFGPMVRGYLESGHGRSGKIGEADSFLLDAQEFRNYGVSWLEQHLTLS